MLTFSWDSQVDTAEMTLYQQSGHLVWHPLGLTGLMSLLSKGTLKSLLQYHSSKASILHLSAFFTFQISHSYMTTGKTIALTRWIFVSTVMSLLCNMLSRLVITFLPRSKHLLISWLQSPSAVIWALQMSQFFTSGGQSIGVSASASVLPMNIQDWLPLGWTGWISLLSKGLSRVFFQHHSWKASVLQCSTFFIVQLSHSYMTTGKVIALTRWTFVGKVMSLLCNMLSSLVLAFLPRSKCLLISWLQSQPAVILGPKKIKSITDSIV